MITGIIPATDELTALYFGLSNLQNIDDIADYALAWDELACMALLAERLALAGMCTSRAAFYHEAAEAQSGEYIRLIDGSFAELIAVEVEA